MTSSPLIPRAVIRCASLSHDGAVPPAELGLRVVDQGPEVEPVIPARPKAAPAPKRHRALVLFGAVATIATALLWASALGERRAASTATPSGTVSLISGDGTPENDEDYRPLTLSLGWSPIADAPQATATEAPAQSKTKWRGSRDRRARPMGTFRKVDDPKPNPYN